MIIFLIIRVFQKGAYFPKLGYLGRPTCLGLGSMPKGENSAFAACLWGMRWPWLRALAMVALPMGVALNMVVWLCRGYFPMEVSWPWEHARGLAMALAMCLRVLPCPWLLAHSMIIFQNRVFFFSFSKRGLFSQMRLFGQTSMLWPWQCAHGGYLGLFSLLMRDALALPTCFGHGCFFILAVMA